MTLITCSSHFNNTFTTCFLSLMFNSFLFIFFFQYIHADPPTKESLAKLLIKFIKYQEIKLGVNAVNPKVTRSPMRCLLNFSPGGSLCLTFSAMYRFKCEQNCRNFGFLKDTDTLVSLIIDIEKILIQAGFIRIPIVYIRPEIQSAYTRNLYKEILEKHGAKMTTTEEKATHIIYPLNGQLDGCARPSFRQGKNIMMHWLQFPESNDTWVTDPNDYYVNIFFQFFKWFFLFDFINFKKYGSYFYF